jgi:FdrA protein
MPTLYRYVPHFYRDSVSLMQFARNLKSRLGADDAAAVMATAANLALLRESGLLAEVLEPRPDDLLLVVRGVKLREEDLDAAAEDLRRPAQTGREGALRTAEPPGSVAEAVARVKDLNFALVSVPGDYAAAEGLKALAAGLHVMLFSDNVPVAREIFLKAEAGRRGLLMLGPDCGTAIVNGAPLGFANRVRRGPVGVVSASGTGAQEVTSLLDRWGSGVSQALGTGGRDLKEEVGGRATLACLEVMAADPATRVVLVVSKPPAASVRRILEARLKVLGKPSVICFVGEPGSPSLAEAARRAFRLAEGREPGPGEPPDLPPNPVPSPAGGRWLRGLYAGGTLCAEAAFLAARALGTVRSNVHVPGVLPLEDPWISAGHTLVDLGADEFTRGRPHPMIDQGLRLDRMAREATDPEVAVLLVDVVLGFGSHPAPAAELAACLSSLPGRPGGLRVPVFASVTGTEADPQGWSASVAVLRRTGVAAYGNNADAVAAALASVPRPQENP